MRIRARRNRNTPEPFDYQKLADAIVEAQQRAKEKEIELEKQENAEAHADWRKILGYKECTKNANWIVKVLYGVRNYIVVVFRLLVFKKKDAKYGVATLVLLKLSLSGILGIIKFLLYIGALGWIAFAITSFCEEGSALNLLTILYAILAILFARVIRIAQLEIENIKDREYLIGVLSAVTSFVAMVLALVALFCEK